VVSEGWSAEVGHAFTHAPHRTQRARNASSGGRPAGGSPRARPRPRRRAGAAGGPLPPGGAHELAAGEIDASVRGRGRGEGPIGDRVLRQTETQLRQTWHSETRCFANGSSAPWQSRTQRGSRCRARGPRGCGRRRRGRRGREGRRAGRGAAPPARDPAVRGEKAEEDRAGEPGPPNVRGRWPSAAIIDDSAGRSAEANERVASEIGSRRPIESVPRGRRRAGRRAAGT